MNETKLFSILMDDHERLSELLDAINHSHDDHRRMSLFPQLRTELELHSEAGEEAIYPKLARHRDGREIAEEAFEEHAEIKGLLSMLASMPKTDARWLDTFDRLIESVDHHIDEEESEIFDKMQIIYDKTQLDKMALDFVSAKERLRKNERFAA